MLQGLTETVLADQLLRIAQEPGLRDHLYERLGEYCHQCRNRLNSLKLSLYLVMRQSPVPPEKRWATIDRHYQELEQRVDQIQSLCRPITLSRVTLGLELLLEDRLGSWTSWMARSGKTLEFVRPSESAMAGFDVERLGQALDAFVAWRAGESDAGSSVKLRWWAVSGYVHLIWEETGESASLQPSTLDSLESAWALPLLARVVLAHQGEFRVHREPGYRLELFWPTSLPSP